MLDLDGMTQEKLTALYVELDAHIRISAKKYGLSVKDAKIIRAYAINKAVAMGLREAANIFEAVRYEDICERLYNQLSESARW